MGVRKALAVIADAGRLAPKEIPLEFKPEIDNKNCRRTQEGT